jgi:hypothetical protein
MKRAALLSALVLLGGCGFAQKHPGVTVGIVSGTIGFGACGLAVEKLGTCSAIGAVTGLVLGGITGLITTFTDTSAHELPPMEEEEETEYRRVKSTTEPPPGLPIDAGVPMAPLDGGAPVAPGDAALGAL